MKKESNILKEAVVFLIVISMVFSTVALANTKTQPQITTTSGHGSGMGARGDIVWDNDMNYDGLCSAQLDAEITFESECADDFHFEEDIEVCDVHWIGGYWGTDYNTTHWPWEIIFYINDGTGTAPGSIYAGPFTYNYGDYTETLIEDDGSIYYEISVDLPQNILFPAYYKFWISIQGIGSYPPQSGWAYHFDPIKLHEAVFRSSYFGYPDWTNWSVVDPPDERDLC